jgi:LuxR family maltose regulon positive regulatory protein
MGKKPKGKRMYYFSHRLKKQLSQIPHYPLTIVEAPYGFGKTTAVEAYLNGNLPPGACAYWYTCLGEPASMAWQGICELLANVNEEIAANLRKLEMPTLDTLSYMTAILREFCCQKETYLVIDNYQLVDCDIPRELMSVFSLHGNSNLHMIFITQQLETNQQFLVHNTHIHTIQASDFFFDREGTSNLFQMEGIRLTEEELESVFMSTEGWVSAIRLQIINFEENGSFDYTADIEHLVEAAIWKRLTLEEKEFLLSVSVLDSFNARQAAIMMGKEVLPEEIEELLKSNDFIRYFPDSGIYNMHSILQDYLRNRFYHLQSEDFQKRILYLAGQSCSMNAQYYLAAQFFFRIKDFEAILSTPFDGEYLANQKEKNILEFVMAVVNECPEEILCKYPFIMLMLAYPMLFDREMESFQKLCRLISSAIEKNQAGLDQKELRRLKGEYMLLTSFTAYNNIRKMSVGRRAALEILGGPSCIIVKNMPWTFGGTSILNMFWSETGKLDDTLQDMDECLPYYLKLTRGHGYGANSVLRAEAMLMRGKDDEAEILCHKALYEARSHQQIDICLSTELVFARIAILRGDVEGYLAAIKNIQSYTKKNSSLSVLRMIDMCLTVTSLILGTTENVAKWFCDMESMKRILYAPTISYAQILYSQLLLIEKQYSVLYGISQQIMDTAKGINYILPQVHQHIFLAVANRNTGNNKEAQGHLKEALTLALQDRVYLPFAQQERMEEFLLESPGYLFRQNGESMDDLITLCRRQKKGVSIIKKALLQTKSPLTPREREIAQLAKDRFSAKEIAGKLYISETTVRTILRNVYSKLDIHSKTELFCKEF